MRAFVLIVTLLTACGGSGGGGGGNPIDSGSHDSPEGVDGSNPGSYDFLCGGGTPCTLDKVCCTNPGPPITFACGDKSTCPAPDQISCDGPDDCTNGDVCCGVDVPDGNGTFPNCGATSIGASCMAASACKTKVVQNCDDTSKVQLCHAPSDCTTEPNNDQCCTFTSGAASLTFCIDSITASLAGGVCM